ncbi:hypothetical protein M758_UG090300 [Ceratodon purpureus]|nr:hypothetical protein M758_UG090300 [Ceratodon purpureus]
MSLRSRLFLARRSPWEIYEASRAGDIERLKLLLDEEVNVNARDNWDSVALYYACLAGHLDAARMLLEKGAICSENTFDGDRCHYASLNLQVRKLLKAFEARPPPLDPLPRSFRELFVSFGANCRYLEGTPTDHSDSGMLRMKQTQNGRSSYETMISNDRENDDCLGPDIIFYVSGRPFGAHRALLAARSPFFKKMFQADWKHRREVRLANPKLTFSALFSLVHFFYTDRLDVAVDDMEDLVRICKYCGCVGLQKVLEKDMLHQKYADYKAIKRVDDSQKRFIFQGSSLPESERMPAALYDLLNLSLKKSAKREKSDGNLDDGELNPSRISVDSAKPSSPTDTINTTKGGDLKRLEGEFNECSISKQNEDKEEDHADVCFLVANEKFRCHRFVLGARSEYFKARFSRTTGFSNELARETNSGADALPVLQEHDLSATAFEKVLEYMYTDSVRKVDLDEAEEVFDAASRYLLFPLKRAVTDALLPQLETATPADLCGWLLMADKYGVWKLREHCLDAMAVNFEIFAGTPEFRRMLLCLPPPSGDLTERTTAPKAPGVEEGGQAGENVLDDLREKWLNEEGSELDKRDESALEFDKRLEQLVALAEEEDE